MLKNSSGYNNEIYFSRDFHSEGLPLLVSANLLRERNMGQIDLGRLNKNRGEWIIEAAEVKSSKVGEEQMQKVQKARLYSSLKFLSSLLGHRSKLIFLTRKGE